MTLSVDFHSPLPTNVVVTDLDNMREHFWFAMILHTLSTSGIFPGWDLYEMRDDDPAATKARIFYYFKGPNNVHLRFLQRNPDLGDWTMWHTFNYKINRSLGEDVWENFSPVNATFGWGGASGDQLHTINWS